MVSLFDSTDYLDPEGDDFNSDKAKEQNLNARPHDDTKLKASYTDECVFKAFKKQIAEFSPQLIAVSCTEDTFPTAISLLQSIKKVAPVIMGGVFPTFAPDLALTYPEVDMICVGEGEHLLAELCDRMDKGRSYDDIPGLYLKLLGGTIRENPMGVPVQMEKISNLT